MMTWKSLRTPFLAITCAGVALVFGRLLLMEANAGAIAYQLPAEVSLPNWQTEPSSELKKRDDERQDEVSGRLYQYRQGDRTLTIEMRYFVGGDSQVRNLLLKYDKPGAATSFPATIQHDPETGYFSLFSDQGNAYLSSCINPRGGSTVTLEQFKQNRYAHDFRVDRIVPVILGQTTLQDGRCLWTFMQIPIQSDDQHEAYRLLKEAWTSWFQQWADQFPPP